MSKWSQKLNNVNKDPENHFKKIQKNYHFSFMDNNGGLGKSKMISRFSTIDPILLKGNSGDVINHLHIVSPCHYR